MTNDFPQEKWNQRYREAAIKDAQPAQVLHENQHLLPGSGTALELACGLGANAMLSLTQSVPWKRITVRHAAESMAWLDRVLGTERIDNFVAVIRVAADSVVPGAREIEVACQGVFAL